MSRGFTKHERATGTGREAAQVWPKAQRNRALSRFSNRPGRGPHGPDRRRRRRQTQSRTERERQERIRVENCAEFEL